MSGPEERKANLFGDRSDWNLPGDNPMLGEPLHLDDIILSRIEARQRRLNPIPYECFGMVSPPPQAFEDPVEDDHERFSQEDPRKAIYAKSDAIRRNR